ncbi:MAG: DUF6090 family protein [Cyclobacteriaceae bacterium]
MLFLLRKIRRKLFSGENKVVSYLLYAIGEIFLVVMGILIAVQIDNWNEKRKMEEKIKAIFVEIQKDLGKDIQKAEEIISFYDQKDSLILTALNGSLTVEDYKSDRGIELIGLTYQAQHIKIHDNGYTKLMENSDNIHPRYQPIVDLLNEIYVYHKYEVDKFDERLNLQTDENWDRMVRTKPWHYQFRSIPDEAVDYFLNDPFYKNELFNYRNFAIFNYARWVSRFSLKAQLAYRMIQQQLDMNAELPSYIAQNKVNISREDTKKLQGTYEVVLTDTFEEEVLMGLVFNIEPFQNHVKMYVGDSKVSIELFFNNKKTIYNSSGTTISFDTAEPAVGDTAVFNSIRFDAKLIKIK